GPPLAELSADRPLPRAPRRAAGVRPRRVDAPAPRRVGTAGAVPGGRPAAAPGRGPARVPATRARPRRPRDVPPPGHVHDRAVPDRGVRARLRRRLSPPSAPCRRLLGSGAVTQEQLPVDEPPASAPRPRRTFVVSLTPFPRAGALDEAGLRAHLERLGAAGIGVYLAGSGSGEGYTLSRDERGRVFAIGVEELGGKVPVRAMGVEPRTAAEVVSLAEDAESAGLDATQVYSLDLRPGYVPTGDEMTTYLPPVPDQAPRRP